MRNEYITTIKRRKKKNIIKTVAKFAGIIIGVACLDKYANIPCISNGLFYVKCMPLEIYDTLKGPVSSAVISASTEDATNIYIATIDECLLEKYVQNGGNIQIVPQEYFSTKNLSGTALSQDEIAGIYEISSKYILIAEESSKWQPTVLHEFGHYLSDTYEIASSPEFKELEKRESSELAKLNAYATTNTEEYFAEAFAYYMVKPTVLEYVAPDTYCYIDDKYTDLCEEF